MKSLYLFFAGTIILLSSCGKAPLACFEITTPVDSFRVGKEIELNAGCSINATSFNWDFGNDLGGENLLTTAVYDSSGTYKINLVVSNGRKSSNSEKIIVIKP